jgi:two-component system C4-dicarboxylate transport sensor histidine kinase DctB
MLMHRTTLILAFVLLASAFSAAVWRYGYGQALDQVARRAEADLALASDRLVTQLQVYQEIAVLSAEHPGFDTTGATEVAPHALLQEIADKTGAYDAGFATVDGTVAQSARGMIAADISQAPYFRRAMQGALGTGHGVVGGRRAYFFAAPAFAQEGHVRGVLVLVVDIEELEQDWAGSTPAVFFTDRAGAVFVSNRSEILSWERSISPRNRRLGPQERIRRLGPHEIWTLNQGPYLPHHALHLAHDLPAIRMTGEVLVDVAGARRLAALQAATVAAIFLAFGAMLFLAMERRRALAQANAVLESRVTARTRALSDTNARLRQEVRERQEAEAALKQAQSDLVQAGKLSALGQMSAGISHELNQPLMAIQQFADNGAAFLERGKAERAGQNLGRISELAARAARIIKNLRAFARNENEPMSRVDLVRVIDTAIDLSATRWRSAAVDLRWSPPTDPVYAWGGEVRLVQVFVNLINNAIDAMAGQSERASGSEPIGKVIEIILTAEPLPTVTVRDTGPGIEDPEKIFEPFYTTKAIGGAEDGMGLGLSISYGLVQSFGGNIRGANADGAGAVFTVELEPCREEDAA